MAKVAIVSDVHLGTRQYGVKERYGDFIQAFANFGYKVGELKPDAVVIGGDLFDSPKPDGRSVCMAHEVVCRMKSFDIKVYGIDGNHDLADGDWLRVIDVVPLHDIPVNIGGASVCGIHYKNGRDLIAAIQDMIDRGIKTDILVAHFALAEMNGGGTADTGVQELCPLLEKLGVKAVLMGHVHIPEAKKWNGILFVNPGSTEMKSSNEPKEKYFFVLDTDTWTAEPVPIETRQMETVEIADEGDLLKFQGALEDEAKKAMDGTFKKRPFYHVIVDDTIDDAFKRVAKLLHDTSAIGRIIMRSSRARDLAPVVDRKESVSTLESAIEARFPKDSDEAKLTSRFLHSPEPSAIHLNVEKFMEQT